MVILILSSCNNNRKQIVQAPFVDSIITHFDIGSVKKANETDMQFWRNRVDPRNPGLVSELKYASCLVKHFHLGGDIHDLLAADSMLHLVNETYRHKEPAPLLALVRNSILQHRFGQADSLLAEAKQAGLKPYESAGASFDVAFEKGNYLLAENELKKIANRNDYGYNFRYAKLAHYKGQLDSAIAAMKRAADAAGNEVYLKQAALSNEADLNLHSGNLQRAFDLYAGSVDLNKADLHSLMGMGWIALVHDHNDSLAERIFRFVQTQSHSPEALYRLVQVAQKKGDDLLQKKYATAFLSVVTQPVYGNMYSRYLIEMYTDILNEPGKARSVAQRELLNRSTPQTYAWYVWTLYNDHRSSEAQDIYEQYVSGRPLEALELYWMGRFMQGLGKGYNAKEYFKAAYRNRYDLSPGMVSDLEKELE